MHNILLINNGYPSKLNKQYTDIFMPKKTEKYGFNIGFASHVSKEKEFDMLAKMVDEAGILEKRFGTKLFFHFICYGTGQEFYAEKYRNDDRVVIHDLYPKDNMPEFYSEIDLLLLLSTRQAESLGLVARCLLLVRMHLRSKNIL